MKIFLLATTLLFAVILVFFYGVSIGKSLQQKTFLAQSVILSKEAAQEANQIAAISESQIFHFQGCLP